MVKRVFNKRSPRLPQTIDQGAAREVRQLERELNLRLADVKRLVPFANAILEQTSLEKRIRVDSLGDLASFDRVNGLVLNLVTYFFSYLYGSTEISRSAREEEAQNMARPELQRFDRALKDESLGPNLLKAIKEYLIAAKLYLPGNQRAFHEIYDELFEDLRSPTGPRSVLDIGCGITGMDWVSLKGLPRNREIVLLDTNHFVFDLLVSFRQRLNKAVQPGIKIIKANLLSYNPPKGKQFDVLIASLILRYIKKELRPAFFAQAKTLLAPQGKLVVADTGRDLDEQEIEKNLKADWQQSGFRVAQQRELVTAGQSGAYFVYDLRLS